VVAEGKTFCGLGVLVKKYRSISWDGEGSSPLRSRRRSTPLSRSNKRWLAAAVGTSTALAAVSIPTLRCDLLVA